MIPKSINLGAGESLLKEYFAALRIRSFDRLRGAKSEEDRMEAQAMAKVTYELESSLATDLSKLAKGG